MYKCKPCNRKYTSVPMHHGHSLEKREQAIRLVLDGNSKRQAARHTGVSPQSVANWLKEYADQLPDKLPVRDKRPEAAEQDELFTFINEIYVMTLVDRTTRCFLSIQAVVKRSQEVAQKMVYQAQATDYYSDQFPLYKGLNYGNSYHLALWGKHLALWDKSETYSVEGDNAELRHYPTRLSRRSRCFSRCIKWLNRHLKAFAHAWNLRQIHNYEKPFDKRHVIDFVNLQN